MKNILKMFFEIKHVDNFLFIKINTLCTERELYYYCVNLLTRCGSRPPSPEHRLRRQQLRHQSNMAARLTDTARSRDVRLREDLRPEQGPQQPYAPLPRTQWKGNSWNIKILCCYSHRNIVKIRKTYKSHGDYNVCVSL